MTITAPTNLHPAPADEGDVRARRLDQARGIEVASHVKRDGAPQRFRRSTERKVEDPNEQLAIEADRALQAQVDAFEEIAFSATTASVLVRSVGAASAEDESTFDADGWVR